VTDPFLPALRRSAHPRIVNTSSVAGSLTRATEARNGGVRGRHVAGHALHVPTPVCEYFLIGPEHTCSTQQ
jgi:NAD(P)-dependent dehydrogenase (short-subunit alcohol dehydrogenase family)